MIIGCGLRVRRASVARRKDTQAESIRSRFAKGELPPEQAIEEALHSNPNSGLAPQLMANFAFTKVYLADQSGSEAGLDGARCFVDMALFDEGSHDWISLGPMINWRARRMSGQFCALESIDLEAAKAQRFCTLRSGLAIGESITDDPALMESIRQTASRRARHR